MFLSLIFSRREAKKTWLALNVSSFTSLKGRCKVILSCLKQEEVDVFKIGFKVVGESANGGKTIMRTVWLVRSITSPWKSGKPASVVQKSYMDKTWFRL